MKSGVLLYFLLSGLVLLLGTGLLITGPSHLAWSAMMPCFEGAGKGLSCEIIWHLRFIRLLSLLESGVALGVAGLLFQGLLKNPLADPGLLGVSSGAGFFILLGMMCVARFQGLARFLSSLYLDPQALLMLCAVVGALVVVGLGAWIVSGGGKRLSPFGVILLGILLNAFFIAMIEGILLVSPTSTLKFYFDWSLSGESRLSATWMGYLGCVILVLIICVYRLSQKLDLWQLGLEEASVLGVNPKSLYGQVLLLGSLLSACSVLLSGPIAFVGLLAPHLGRALVGQRHQKLLPAVVLISILLVWTAGWLCALIDSMAIPLSLMLTVIGVPCVMWVLVRLSRQGKVFYE